MDALRQMDVMSCRFQLKQEDAGIVNSTFLKDGIDCCGFLTKNEIKDCYQATSTDFLCPAHGRTRPMADPLGGGRGRRDSSASARQSRLLANNEIQVKDHLRIICMQNVKLIC